MQNRILNSNDSSNALNSSNQLTNSLNVSTEPINHLNIPNELINPLDSLICKENFIIKKKSSISIKKRSNSSEDIVNLAYELRFETRAKSFPDVSFSVNDYTIPSSEKDLKYYKNNLSKEIISTPDSEDMSLDGNLEASMQTDNMSSCSSTANEGLSEHELVLKSLAFHCCDVKVSAQIERHKVFFLL